nr:site-specific integrase [uncultured Oscillibacter sp.]
MASIRKRGNSYLLVVSMGYDHTGKRRATQQKTVRPPEGLTPKQKEKWLNEQAVLFERECKDTPLTVDKSITLAQYVQIWLRDIAPDKLAKSTLARDKQDIDRFLPYLGGYKLVDLRPEYFRKLYAELRKQTSQNTGMPLSEYTVEGVHACLCGILSDAMEGGFLNHNPAWRTYKYSGKRKEKLVADEETMQKIITALENESIKYETYYKLIIATGMRRGECCGLKWSDIDYERKSIHIQRNVVKITGEDIIVKDTKTAAGDRYVYFSPEMESLLKEYYRECVWQADAYENRELTADDFVFRKHDSQDPMTPSTFTWRFKLILKKNGLPEKLNVHSLRHSNASLLIAGGADVATVAGLLGHSQPSTTLDIYTHAFDKNKKAASEALQRGLDI